MLRVFEDSRCDLGEGLFNDGDTLYWVDINASLLYIRKKSVPLSTISLPEMASSIWRVVDNKIYLVAESGICSYDMSRGSWNNEVQFPLQINRQFFRSNDGGELTSRDYIFGTMQRNPKSLGGSLYWTDGINIKEIYKGIGIPNTFIRCAEREMLISDSFTRQVYKFTFDLKSKSVAKKSIWLDLRDGNSVPDGGCIDSQGHIYIAMWDGHCVNKYGSNTELIESYPVPVPRPTNCALSRDEKFLFITSAREELTKEQLAQYPESGSVFQLDLLSN